MSSLDAVLVQSFDAKISCDRGGLCRVGDVGPGGGRVFRVDAEGEQAIDPKTNKPALAHYWEVAPRDWAGAGGDAQFVFTCGVDRLKLDSENLSENAKTLRQRCGGGPARQATAAAADFRGRAAGWYLPRLIDMEALASSGVFNEARSTKATSSDIWSPLEELPRASTTARYWTSDLVECGQASQCPVVVSTDRRGEARGPYDASPTASGYFDYVLPCAVAGESSIVRQCARTDLGRVRPVRAFGFTTQYSCSSGGPCAVGDIGPHGGLVFYASSFLAGKAGGGSSGGSRTSSAVEFLVRPDVSTTPINGQWCSAVPKVGLTGTQFGDGVRNFAALSDSGDPKHRPCDVMNHDLDQWGTGINLPFAPAFAKSFRFVPSKDELEAICVASTKTAIVKGYFPEGQTGADAKSRDVLGKYAYCGLSLSAVTGATSFPTLGIWSSSAASGNSAWAWSFRARKMVAVDITDPGYTVVLATEFEAGTQQLAPLRAGLG